MRRRSIKKAEVVLFIVLVIVIAVAAVYSSYDAGRGQPPYTVFCTGEEGVSVLYESMKLYYNKKQSDVKIAYAPTEDFSMRDVMIVIAPDSFYFEDLRGWVEAGGRLIYAPLGEQKAPYLRTYGLGDVFTIPAEMLINSTFMEDGDYSGGEMLINLIDAWGYDNIYFNEYYHGFVAEKGGMWQDLPVGFKVFVIQLFIAAAALILYLGKRFGKPRPYYEEEERTENEYILALANLFHHAKRWQWAADLHYNSVIASAARNFGVTAGYAKTHIREMFVERGLDTTLLDETMKYMNEPKGRNIKRIAENCEKLKRALY